MAACYLVCFVSCTRLVACLPCAFPQLPAPCSLPSGVAAAGPLQFAITFFPAELHATCSWASGGPSAEGPLQPAMRSSPLQLFLSCARSAACHASFRNPMFLLLPAPGSLPSHFPECVAEGRREVVAFMFAKRPQAFASVRKRLRRVGHGGETKIVAKRRTVATFYA